MSIDDPQLITGIAALVAGLAALIFAIIQTVAALAQYIQVSSRCSPRVTGVFNLTAGFWFQVSSLSWNPQYRMPVITLPGLRGEEEGAPVMEGGGNGFRPGRNFRREGNAYVDYERVRVVRGKVGEDGKREEKRPVKVLPTAVLSVFAAAWTPVGAVISALLLVMCFPPAFCCGCVCAGGCGGYRRDFRLSNTARSIASDMLTPLTFAWKLAIRYKEGSGPRMSSAPGLEPAAWCQLLVNFQDVWWGHANIRWEWRLATMIPLDVYGATIETTMADLRLLAAVGGMQPTSDPVVLARTRCGEMLVHSRHLVLGRMVYYRSGRENILPRLTRPVPTTTSRILQCTTAVHNHLAKRATAAIPASVSKLTSHPSRDAIAALLSRPRTEFDAQIHCSQGDLAWLFTTETFKILANGLKATDLGWTFDEARVFLGPLGEGVGGCSCLACCREWVTRKAAALSDDKVRMSNERRKEMWPALELWVTESATIMTQPADGAGLKAKIVGPFMGCMQAGAALPQLRVLCGAAVPVQTLRACGSGACLDPVACRCGSIARIGKTTAGGSAAATVAKMMFAVAGMNTSWLGKCSRALLDEAADSLADWVSEQDQGSAELRRKVSRSLATAWETLTTKTSPGPRTAQPAQPAQPLGSPKGPALKANVDLVRAVMAYTEVCLMAVRKEIGSSSMWEGPATELFDDFGPVVLGA